MPRLPDLLSQVRVPRGTNVPLRTQPVPPVPSPTAPADFGQAVPAALDAAGEDIEQAAQLEQRRAAAAAKINRAQDVLDAKHATHEFEIAYQQQAATLAEGGDFRTLPAQTVQVGRDLMATMREGMRPSVAQRFEAEALDVIRVAQANALGIQQDRRESFRQFVLTQGIELRRRGIAEADNEADALHHLDALDDLLTSGVTHGVLAGEDAAAIRQKTLDEAVVARWRRRLRLKPAPTVQILRDMAADGTALVGGHPITELIDEGQTLADQAVQRQARADAAAERELDARYDATEAAYRAELSKPGITPTVLDGLRQSIIRDQRAHNLGREGLDRLLDEVDTIEGQLTTRATRGTALSDNAYRRQAAILVATADSVDDLERARAYILSNAGQARGSTVAAALNSFHGRTQDTVATNQPLYREGVRIIASAAFPGGIIEAKLDRLDEGIQKRLESALDVYRDTMVPLYQSSISSGNNRAIVEAEQIKAAYFPREVTARTLPPLPPELADLSYAEALIQLDAMPIPRPLKLKYFEALQLHREAQRQKLEDVPTQAQTIEREIRDEPGFFQGLLDLIQ